MVDSFSEEKISTSLKIDAFKSSLKVIKKDNDTKDLLEGVKFNFKYVDGTNIGDYITDKNGEIIINNLKQGEVIIKEMDAPENYILSDKVLNVNVGYNDKKEIIIENEHKKGNLCVYKVDKDNDKIVIKDVGFKLYSNDENKIIGSYITDENGEINISDLRIGNYTLIEESTNEWYNLGESKEFKVKWNEITDIKVENELKKSQIRIIKVDKDNNEKKLKDVKFDILDKKGNVLETVVTNENGEAYTKKYALKDYKYLVVKEVETNDEYELDNNIREIELKENEIQDVIFENEKIKGKIKIIKIAEKDNLFTCQKSGDNLEDVEFGIYDENKNLIEKVITDKNGVAYSSELLKGKKYVKELKAAKYFILDDTEYCVEINKQGEVKELILTNKPEVPEENKPKEIVITKLPRTGK